MDLSIIGSGYVGLVTGACFADVGHNVTCVDNDTHNIQEGVANSQIIFIAVPTPPQSDGSVDLSFIEKVAREIAGVLTDYRVIVDKSTVPVDRKSVV